MLSKLSSWYPEFARDFYKKYEGSARITTDELRSFLRHKEFSIDCWKNPLIYWGSELFKNSNDPEAPVPWTNEMRRFVYENQIKDECKLSMINANGNVGEWENLKRLAREKHRANQDSCKPVHKKGCKSTEDIWRAIPGVNTGRSNEPAPVRAAAAAPASGGAGGQARPAAAPASGGAGGQARPASGKAGGQARPPGPASSVAAVRAGPAPAPQVNTISPAQTLALKPPGEVYVYYENPDILGMVFVDPTKVPADFLEKIETEAFSYTKFAKWYMACNNDVKHKDQAATVTRRVTTIFSSDSLSDRIGDLYKDLLLDKLLYSNPSSLDDHTPGLKKLEIRIECVAAYANAAGHFYAFSYKDKDTKRLLHECVEAFSDAHAIENYIAYTEMAADFSTYKKTVEDLTARHKKYLADKTTFPNLEYYQLLKEELGKFQKTAGYRASKGMLPEPEFRKILCFYQGVVPGFDQAAMDKYLNDRTTLGQIGELIDKNEIRSLMAEEAANGLIPIRFEQLGMSGYFARWSRSYDSIMATVKALQDAAGGVAAVAAPAFKFYDDETQFVEFDEDEQKKLARFIADEMQGLDPRLEPAKCLEYAQTLTPYLKKKVEDDIAAFTDDNFTLICSVMGCEKGRILKAAQQALDKHTNVAKTRHIIGGIVQQFQGSGDGRKRASFPDKGSPSPDVSRAASPEVGGGPAGGSREGSAAPAAKRRKSRQPSEGVRTSSRQKTPTRRYKASVGKKGQPEPEVVVLDADSD